MSTLPESCLVALTLSGVARLNQAFNFSNSAYEKKRLLHMAADLLDRTLPYPDLKAKLAAGVPDQVAALVEGRSRIAAVPPKLWRASSVQFNELANSHYRGLRALERALKKDFSNHLAMWGSITEWLEPAWAEYPDLKTDCLPLAPVGGAPE